jgi:signal transduction histidine kinase
VGDLALAVNRLAEQLSARVEALRAEETLVRELAESLNEGILALDARQQVVRLNETARTLLNLRTPLPFGPELLPRDRAFRDAMTAALAGETVHDAEAAIGGRILNVTARPLDHGGAVVALLDLTRLRRLETVRRDFVANVSHELKTPLTVVRGFAETLADDDPPAETRRQFAQSIASHTRRMQRLVDDLLDLSRIESGGWVPEPQLVDFASVIADDVSTMRATADRKGIRLDAAVDDGAETLFADPTALRQVVGNFVDNALRHTTSGGVTVRAQRDGHGVTVSVSDTGCGIDAEHLPRALLPGRPRTVTRTGRHRARPLDREASGGCPRRTLARHEYPQRWHDTQRLVPRSHHWPLRGPPGRGDGNRGTTVTHSTSDRNERG